jgi:hypothetical protein
VYHPCVILREVTFPLGVMLSEITSVLWATCCVSGSPGFLGRANCRNTLFISHPCGFSSNPCLLACLLNFFQSLCPLSSHLLY